MLPDTAVYNAFVETLPLTPLSYCEEIAPDTVTPSRLAMGYLQLSAAYNSEAGDAVSNGWRVERIDSHHLAPLTNPELVGAALDKLSREILEQA